ncbi:uncharacterized protein LOC120340514 [Styela clava]
MTMKSYKDHIIVLFVLQLWAGIDAQTTSIVNNLTTIPEVSNTNNATTNAPPTTAEFIPREITDITLPPPRNLQRRTATTTTLILSFLPPANYRNDARYSHFRIDYESDTEKQNIEVDKNLGGSRIIVPGLQSGVLYKISVRTQGKDSLGNYLLSPVAQTIKARTVPPPISNLRIVSMKNRPDEVYVVWDGSPTPINGPKYDIFTLTYRIVDKLTSTQAFKYRTRPIDIPHKQASAFISSSATNVSQAVRIELGATYSFSVVTKSLGEDPTTSLPLKIRYEFKVPGPGEADVVRYDTTSILFGWEDSYDIKDSDVILSYSPFGKDDSKEKVINISNKVQEYNITALKPGVLYLISIKYIRNSVPFGKVSEATDLYARTAPSLPNEIFIDNITTTQVFLNFEFLNMNASNVVIIEYELIRSERRSSPISYNLQEATSIQIIGLEPGQLYRIHVTVSTLEPVRTTSSTSMLTRTVPMPPKSFSGYGKQGKILLNWEKPDTLETPTFWRYEVVYHPVSDSLNVNRISVWNRDGAQQMTHSLDNLAAGTLYKIQIYCEVGDNRENDRKARSVSSIPLVLYTQPQNPILTDLVQVTLSQVKIQWAAVNVSVANMDYYLLNLTRIYKSNSAIEFQPEFLSYKIHKQETEKVLKLSLGSTYRIVLTTVVGEGNSWMQSVVNVSNSKLYDTWSPYDSHQLFPRLVWRFSNCLRQGRIGPTQVYCNNAYRKTSLDKLTTVEFGIQHWMAPIQGLYRITATGAGYEGPGGKGATVSGLFHLLEGAKLMIAVGQQGEYFGDMTQGGAGGSFVVAGDGTNEPIVIAGGAGSAFRGASPSSLSDGRLNHTAGDASATGQGFGSGGKQQTVGPGLPGASNTAGGAGFHGISRSLVNFGDTALPAVGFLPFGNAKSVNDTERQLYQSLAGGRYDIADGRYSEGGFGGGGSGYITASGGGGGYTGGGGGSSNGFSGGGGSYIKFSGGTQYAEIFNDKAGMVEITFVGLPVSSPIPVTMYLIVAFFVGIGMTLCFGSLLCWIDKCGRKRNSEPENMREKPEILHLHETTVHVTDASPSTSGLYVRNIKDQEDSNYRKYSEVDSEMYVPNLRVAIPDAPRLSESEESWGNPLKPTDYDPNEDSELDDEDIQTESSASPVPSINTDLGDITRDIYAWDITTVDDESEPSESEDESQFSKQETTDEVSSLPPPPPPPPLEGLHTSEQQENFRNRLQMFHQIENKMSF